MIELFLRIFNMSVAASYLVLAVVLLRLVLKRSPKWITVALWGLVAIRLLCPFNVESALSLIPSAQTVSPDIITQSSPAINSGFSALNSTLNPVIGQLAPSVSTPAQPNPLEIFLTAVSVLWVVGMASMALYSLISYWRLRRRVATAVRLRDNIFRSEFVASPFVLGFFRPKIYLSNTLDATTQKYVIAHERAHICRRDHWWKPLGFLLLSIHWFNPLMWLSYILLCRDIELACDEKVIRELGTEARADYSQALLNCSIRRGTIAACPLAFGEVGVKERVKKVLNYKKPAFWIIVTAVILCVVVAFCFLTDPPKRDSPTNPAEVWYESATATVFSSDQQLDAFPDTTFHWDTSKVTAIHGEKETVLIQALVIRSLYAADLNEDGCPEICAMVDNKSGMYDCHVIVYDYAAGTAYAYGPERNTYAYYLYIEDGYLMCSQIPFDNPGIVTASGRLVFVETTEGKMLAMEGSTTPTVPTVITWYEQDNEAYDLTASWQLDSFPGVTFRVKGDCLMAEQNGESTVLFYFGTLEKIYLSDITGDGKPDICAQLTGFCTSSASVSLGKRSAIIVYDLATGCSYGLSGEEGIDLSYTYYSLRVEEGYLVGEKKLGGFFIYGPPVPGLLSLVETATGTELYLAPLPEPLQSKP